MFRFLWGDNQLSAVQQPFFLSTVKRSLGLRYWQRPVQIVDKPLVQHGLRPLVEEPALQSTELQALAPSQFTEGRSGGSSVKPYGGGGFKAVLNTLRSGPVRQIMMGFTRPVSGDGNPWLPLPGFWTRFPLPGSGKAKVHHPRLPEG